MTHHESDSDSQDDSSGGPLGPEQHRKEVSDEIIEDDTVFGLIGILGRLRLPRSTTWSIILNMKLHKSSDLWVKKAMMVLAAFVAESKPEA